MKDACQLCCASISPPSVIFISCIAETLKVLHINPALRGTASRNKLYHQCLHRRFKPVTLYAIVTFPKALYVLESLHYRTRSFLSPQSLIFSFPSIHPSRSVLSTRLLLPSCAVRAQKPGLNVSACHRTEHYGTAELNSGSEPHCPALEAGIGIVIGHMGFGGVVLACPLVDLLGLSQPTQRMTVEFWDWTTFQLSPFTYCSKMVHELFTVEPSVQDILNVTSLWS